jgi:hypothetical protein
MFRARVARAVRISGGVGLMALGVAMLVLPGPGILTLALGVALVRRDLPGVGAGWDRLVERVRALVTRPKPEAELAVERVRSG